MNMKQFLVTIKIGNYPFTYRANTIYDALQCLMAAASRLIVSFDEDDLMRSLVDMKFNGALVADYGGFVIEAIDASEDLPQ